MPPVSDWPVTSEGTTIGCPADGVKRGGIKGGGLEDGLLGCAGGGGGGTYDGVVSRGISGMNSSGNSIGNSSI